MRMKENLCTLCQLEVRQDPIIEGNDRFCCYGCQAVYKVLDAKSQTTDFQSHPVFKAAVQSGLISNPELLAQIRSHVISYDQIEIQRIHFEVGEMWCPYCAEMIRLVLLQEKGVKNCVVDYATDFASIEFAPLHISKDKIFEIIRSLGYSPQSWREEGGAAVSYSLYLRFLVAAFFSMNIMMFAYPLYATYFNYDSEGAGTLFAWLSCAASIPVLTYSAWPILQRFWNSLKMGLFGMEALVVLGVSAAFGLSLYELLQVSNQVYFDSMTVIIAFVLLGKIVESKAKFTAKDSLMHLARALPRRGRKLQPDGSYQYVPVKDIASGDILSVSTGEKIILDGVVVEGSGTCDESLMTGESVPVPKEPGKLLLGGTVLQQGRLSFRVQGTLEDTALQRIINAVRGNLDQKSAYVRAVDPIVRRFAPLVAFVAVLALFSAATFEEGIIRAVSVLLIACPCAVGIAAPLAEAHLINSLAKIGVLVRNRGVLRYLGRETVQIFDKTGTLTEGRFEIQSGLESLNDRQKAILKGICAHSNHPIALTLFRNIDTAPAELELIEEYPSKGMKGRCQGVDYYLGSGDFLKQNEIPAEGITTTVYFGETALKLGDKIRSGMVEVIAKMRNVSKVLLSGDSETAVSAVAKACGIPVWRSLCNPLEKRDYVDKLRRQGQIVGMIGDGINDAPALTAAHVGISVVSAADISIHVSDLLLTTDNPQVLLRMRDLARFGRKIIHQNLFWAFFYNVIGVGLAAFGLLTPIFAASAMVLSSLFVLLNAQRIRSRINIH